MLACHPDQPSTTHLCNTHFLSDMVFHLRLLDAEKALQSLQTSGAACPATWHHIPEQLKLRHFWNLNCHCDVLTTFLVDCPNIRSVSFKRKSNKSLCVLKKWDSWYRCFSEHMAFKKWEGDEVNKVNVWLSSIRCSHLNTSYVAFILNCMVSYDSLCCWQL